MSRELRLEALLGRSVCDVDGRGIGRIVELEASIELRETGSEYLVTTFHIGYFGMFDWLAGSHFARHLLLLLGRSGGHRHYCIPWDLMDLSDPLRPRLTRRIAELSA